MRTLSFPFSLAFNNKYINTKPDMVKKTGAVTPLKYDQILKKMFDGSL